MRRTILPSCSPASSRSCAARASASRKTSSTTGRPPPARPHPLGAPEFRLARGGREAPPPAPLRDRERPRRAPAADPQDDPPFPRLEPRLGDEHAVCGLEDERKRRGLLEAELVR